MTETAAGGAGTAGPVVVRIPADVEMQDRIIGRLTARQLAIVAATGVVFYAGWWVLRAVAPALPVWVFVAVAVVVGAAVAVAVLTERDGTTLDRLVVAAVGHRVGTRAARPDSDAPAVPGWIRRRAVIDRGGPHVADAGDRAAGVGGSARVPRRAVGSPVRGVWSSTDVGAGGQRWAVVDLGGDGLAVVAECSTVALGWRSPGEQADTVAGWAAYLDALGPGAVQVISQAVPVDLGARIEALEAVAQWAHPAVADAAADHARLLSEIGQSTGLIGRRVLLVLREPAPASPTATAGRWWAGAGRPAPAGGEDRAGGRGARRATLVAETRLTRRLDDAAELLGRIGIRVRALDPPAARLALADALSPGRPPGAATRDPHGVTIGAHPDQHEQHEQEGRRGRWARPARAGRGGPRAPLIVSGPGEIRVGARSVDLGGDHVTVLLVTGWPREVTPGWLDPLLTYPGRVDVSVFFDPVDPYTAETGLRRRMARLEAGRRSDAGHGRLPDPHVEAAVADAHDLSARIARGQARLYRVGLYLAVHAEDPRELADQVAAVRALAASVMLDLRPASYRQLAGVTACLPIGVDAVAVHRIMDTDAASAVFPFTGPELPTGGAGGDGGDRDGAGQAAGRGVFYGYDLTGPGLVFWDRFGLDNHNAVVLGRSGSGRSYLVKTEIIRSLYRGIYSVIVDPEDEYTRLVRALGGTVIRLGAPDARINPLDLPAYLDRDGRRRWPRDAMTRARLFVHTLCGVLVADAADRAADPAIDRAVLDTAITDAYARAGITEDPATWGRPAPQLADLVHALTGTPSGADPSDGDPDSSAPDSGGRADGAAGAQLARRLQPFVSGAFAGLFGPTTLQPRAATAHLVSFSLRELAEELRPAGTLLVLDWITRHVGGPAARPRFVAVDEAWLLLQSPAGARWLAALAKTARKRWIGLTLCTQDVADVLGTDLGRVVVSNAATQILMRQAPQAIDTVTAQFGLTAGERAFLLRAERGHALLCAGPHRAAFQSAASGAEHDLITTDPTERPAGPGNGDPTSDHADPYADPDGYSYSDGYSDDYADEGPVRDGEHDQDRADPPPDPRSGGTATITAASTLDGERGGRTVRGGRSGDRRRR